MWKNRKIDKKTVVTIWLAAVCLWLLAGCAGLPSYNLSDGGDPTDVVVQFLDAVVSGSDANVSELVDNYVWQSDEGSLPFDGAAVSETDLEVWNCVQQSRAYELAGKSASFQDEHHATVSVTYTSFDVGKFQAQLTEQVVAEIKQRQYEGEVFSDPSDTTDIIERHKAALLQNPEDFDTTQSYDLELVSRKGHWRIVLSDEFYNALTGYAL